MRNILYTHHYVSAKAKRLREPYLEGLAACRRIGNHCASPLNWGILQQCLCRFSILISLCTSQVCILHIDQSMGEQQGPKKCRKIFTGTAVSRLYPMLPQSHCKIAPKDGVPRRYDKVAGS